MNKDEALRLALEAMESFQNGTNGLYEGEFEEEITAIKAALEAKDEPVAWMFQHEETGRTMCVDAQQLEWGFEKGNPRLKKIAHLYTTPPQRTWVSLTDEEVGDLSDFAYANDEEFVRQVEKHLKEKNNG